MKALLCKQFGPIGDLVVEDIPALIASPGQVVIGVGAAGINFPDALIVQGKYQLKPPFPFSPGLEVAGVVLEIGECVSDFTPGQRVIGFPGVGGLAEEVAVEAALVFPIPDSMEFAEAAGFIVTYATSHHALKRRGQLKHGETLLVLGAAGGVGLTAVELGKLMGARVIAAASSDEKLALCKEYGADDCVNYATEPLRDRVKELTGGKGVDVVYDPVGGDYAEPMVRALAWQGRYLIVGFAAGDIPKIPLNLVLLKSAALLGVFLGGALAADPKTGREDIAELLSWHAEGRLKPCISATYPLERAAEAIELVSARATKGKLVVVME